MSDILITEEQRLKLKELDALVGNDIKKLILNIIHPEIDVHEDDIEFFSLGNIVANHMRVMNSNKEWLAVRTEEFKKHYKDWEEQHKKKVISDYERNLKYLTLGELADRIAAIKD